MSLCSLHIFENILFLHYLNACILLFSAKVIEGKNQNVKEAVVEQKITKKKLYPQSPLFRSWGAELTEEEQMEAERQFQEFGYNVFLSNRLPLNRTIPDTRDIR